MTTQLELSSLKRDWIDLAAEQFKGLVASKPQFTSDDLMIGLSTPENPNWVGCLIAKLRKAGRIREIGRVKSTRPERNGAKITLWQTV